MVNMSVGDTMCVLSVCMYTHAVHVWPSDVKRGSHPLRLS